MEYDYDWIISFLAVLTLLEVFDFHVISGYKSGGFLQIFSRSSIFQDGDVRVMVKTADT